VIVKHPKTWIVVADGARARFFERSRAADRLLPATNADMIAVGSRGHARDLKSDKPGRGFSSSRSGARHALEPPHDYHKLEKHKFAVSVARVLDAACESGEFEQLILVAPRRSLGELRKLMSPHVQGCLRQEIAKDLTSESPARILERLKELGV
jgi:protein required for attachment to host cells